MRGREVTIHGSDPHNVEYDTGVGVGYDNVWVTDDETGDLIDLTEDELDAIWDLANQYLADRDWGDDL